MNEKKLLDALTMAMSIIESYQADINEMRSQGVLKDGFCQGAVYKYAIKDIKQRAGTELNKADLIKLKYW